MKFFLYCYLKLLLLYVLFRMGMYKFLQNIDSPNDLKALTKSELSEYCAELRSFIIEKLSSNPGHLGSSLGTIELSVALHYVMNTPDDKLIWDVGHQAYAHKIITGRRDRFDTNRKLGGLSGFPRMCESPYDAFGTGHSSTSISAALGIAAAAGLKGEKRQVVAVIGDGALTGGLAFEGLNNAGIENTDLLVILNDNRIAIDESVGAMHEYLLKISTSAHYNKMKRMVWDMMSITPRFRRACQKVLNGFKQSILKQSNLFESLNFRYFGPLDGHDVVHLTKVLEDLRQIKGPKLLHVITKKGKGYKPAETNQVLWHAPGKFKCDTGGLITNTDIDKPPKFQDVFGETIVELAEQNPNIVGITPAMPTGCSLSVMMHKMPKRTFDVGIAEGHAVTFSAGLAASGIVPFCNIYSSFMQRAYDNVIHDVALQNLNVVFCLDRGGLVGEDGATHHGIFDIAYFRPIPNMTISAPMNEVELRNLMYTAQLPDMGAFVIRYPRGNGVTVDWRKPFERVDVGRARRLKDGRSLAVLTLGEVGNFAVKAIDRFEAEHPDESVEHIDMRFAKPLDINVLHDVGARFKNVITVENGVVMGGFGSGVVEFFADNGYDVKVIRLGVPDKFIEHGTMDELYSLCGIDSAGIYAAISACV